MSIDAVVSRAPRRCFSPNQFRSAALGRMLVFTGMLILPFAGTAQAIDPVDVGLAIQNDLDSNGNITVITGSKIKVAYSVIMDAGKILDGDDKIELRRVSDDKLVDRVERGKKKNGTVSLKVKKSVGERLYVQYVKKGKAATLIKRISHPDDPGSTPLTVIARASLDEVNVRLNAADLRYEVGDAGPAGGLVFYVDKTGRHGLEAATTDQGTFNLWYNGSNTDTAARGDGIGAGGMNTMLIVASQGTGAFPYAAKLCANLVVSNGGIDYGDWYLPSIFELQLMQQNIGAGSGYAGALTAGFQYWSSTEVNNTSAQYIFANGDVATTAKDNNKGVRAIRAF